MLPLKNWYMTASFFFVFFTSQTHAQSIDERLFRLSLDDIRQEEVWVLKELNFDVRIQQPFDYCLSFLNDYTLSCDKKHL